MAGATMDGFDTEAVGKEESVKPPFLSTACRIPEQCNADVRFSTNCPVDSKHIYPMQFIQHCRSQHKDANG